MLQGPGPQVSQRQDQASIDRANEEFWDELCSSSIAKRLGIKDNSSASLALLDKWYLDFYPYLLPLVGYDELRNKKVLEAGLGYGTLGQKLAEVASEYTGIDIANGPVAMMNHRIQMNNLPGQAVKGNILKTPFADESFDAVVSVGCFHHTGNLQGCIDETYRILRPNGKAFVMVYNQFSYLQWTRWPGRTLHALLSDYGIFKVPNPVIEEQIASYDVNLKGTRAPETVFTSTHRLRDMFSAYGKVSFTKINCESKRFLNFTIDRNALMPILGRSLGLDIYIAASKSGDAT